MDIRGKNLLVIGGAGLIGSHTVEALLKHDVNKVIVYDNFARGTVENLRLSLQDPRCMIFEGGGDILHADVLEAAMKGIDGVFHLAALWLLQCHEFPRTAFDVNVNGSFNVFRACVKAGIQRLVYSSSASVYGDAEITPMNESHPFNNKNLYGATKICGEALLRSFHFRYGLNYVGLRYMNVYGPRQDYQGAYTAVIMKMLNAIDLGEGPLIFGDGSEAFDFVSVQDCALANVLSMKSSLRDTCYNVCTGISTTLLELAEILLELTGCNQQIRFSAESSKTLVRSRVGCPRKAQSEIGFKAEIRLREGLQDLIDWRTKSKNSESIY